MSFFSVGYREACFISPKSFSIFNAAELAPGFFTPENIEVLPKTYLHFSSKRTPGRVSYRVKMVSAHNQKDAGQAG
jgi:hypothetical protein